VILRREALHAAVADPDAGTMNFLNEIAARFPAAISLAAGRPYDGFYEVADIGRALDTYTAHRCDDLLQYGRTNGQIGDLIARYLAVDEDVHVDPSAVAVTAGCQEAMVIVLRGLCAGPREAVLAVEPTYVGISGAARLLGIPVVPVPEGPEGLDPQAVTAAARTARAAGLHPRALYVIPNFANPSGHSLPLATRRELLRAAADADLLILEDDPYGLFGLADDPVPSLKSLDTDRQVVYIGSFAKSCFPGPRVGFLVADQTVVDATGRRTVLADELSAVKSMLTVNTSPIAQAVIGGVLIAANGSLRAANRDKRAFYRRNLRVLRDALAAAFGDDPEVRWNDPDGGFFVVVHVPVPADEKLAELSAREYGVLWTPMRFFYAGDGGSHALRLSVSALGPAAIVEGVRRLARLIGDVR
jgi:(S)-3,5-dihydroxyphenylglycine transaminase